MNTNPALNAYRKIKEQKEEPKTNKTSGLLTRSNAIKRAGKADPKEEVSMRVARYVNNIRNYNA